MMRRKPNEVNSKKMMWHEPNEINSQKMTWRKPNEVNLKKMMRDEPNEINPQKMTWRKPNEINSQKMMRLKKPGQPRYVINLPDTVGAQRHPASQGWHHLERLSCRSDWRGREPTEVLLGLLR